MKITMESTTRIVELVAPGGGIVPARMWEGQTESGIAVQVLVTRVAVLKTDDCSQFESELKEQKAPSVEWMAFPLRMIL